MAERRIHWSRNPEYGLHETPCGRAGTGPQDMAINRVSVPGAVILVSEFQPMVTCRRCLRAIYEADLDDAHDRLMVAGYTAAEADRWLAAPHPQLDGLSAHDAIAAMRLPEVVAIINRMEAGAYL